MLVMKKYHIFRTIRHTQVLEEENRKKNFEAKNVVKYLITSFKAEILFCFDIFPQLWQIQQETMVLYRIFLQQSTVMTTITTVSFIVMEALQLRTSVDDALLWGDLLLTPLWGKICCWRATGCVTLLCGDSSFAQHVWLFSCCQITAPITPTCPSMMGVVGPLQLLQWPH